MAPVVLAHHVQSEDEVTIERSPDDYADHVREMTATWGGFDLSVDEFLVDGTRAYVRLTQVGRHLGPVDGRPPTGRASSRQVEPGPQTIGSQQSGEAADALVGERAARRREPSRARGRKKLLPSRGEAVRRCSRLSEAGPRTRSPRS
jgi:hypothetical protein